MSARKEVIGVGKKYKRLIDRFALKPVESEEELDLALELTEELYDKAEKDELDKEEADYLAVLGMLIEAYESKNAPKWSDNELSADGALRWLMEVNNIKQVEIAKALGVEKGRASELVNGRRKLSARNIALLADYFHVEPGLFMSAVTSK